MEMPKHLTIEFITQLVQALLMVALLAQSRIVTFGGRVAFVPWREFLPPSRQMFRIGIGGASRRLTRSRPFIRIVGFFVLGLVAAFLFRKSDAEGVGLSGTFRGCQLARSAAA